MQEMIDVMSTDAMNTSESVGTDFMPEMADPQVELGEEITSLWAAHANAKIASRATNEELRTLRARLGEQLSVMKRSLAKPGRGGQWSSFLMERGIPRATGDRLVGRHLRSLNPEDANRLIEPISQSTEEDVRKLFASVWPKLRRTLRSRQSLLQFIDLLTSQFESSEAADREVLVLAESTPTICSASSDGDSVDVRR
ncbi:MAG: hypothetical protein ABSD53_09680 [Terriglobales bacterium]|jgi:hypothetical protein